VARTRRKFMPMTPAASPGEKPRACSARDMSRHWWGHSMPRGHAHGGLGSPSSAKSRPRPTCFAHAFSIVCRGEPRPSGTGSGEVDEQVLTTDRSHASAARAITEFIAKS
jgi:hypothetical protein